MEDAASKPTYDLPKLREIIARAEVADLRVICFDLKEDKEDYDAIVGDGKNTREAALAIVKYFDNRGRTAELVARVRQEFPSAEWDAVVQQQATKEVGSAKQPSHEAALPTRLLFGGVLLLLITVVLFVVVPALPAGSDRQTPPTQSTNSGATLAATAIGADPTRVGSTPSPIPSSTVAVASTATADQVFTLTPSASPVLPTSISDLGPNPTLPETTIGSILRITVQGVGVAKDTTTNPVLREREAILAAEIDAKRKLAEWINGSDIEAVAIVSRGALVTDTIRQVVRAIVPAPKMIQRQYDAATGSARVTLELVVDQKSLP